MTKQIPARDLKVGDRLVAGVAVTYLVKSPGNVYAWTDKYGTDNRPTLGAADIVLSHGDPVKLRDDRTKVTVTFTFDVEAPLSETVKGALDSLADVMLVQAEDGLYDDGNPDQGNYVASLDNFTTTISTQEV